MNKTDTIEQDELLDEIITILMAALSLAGVKDECMPLALEAYQNVLENVDDDKDYDYKSICNIILNLKKTNKELFK